MDTSMHSEAPNTETVRKAQLTVSRFASDPEECRTFLAMLGIANVPPAPCRECGGPMSRLTNLGRTRQAGDGLCGLCFSGAQRALREEGEG